MLLLATRILVWLASDPDKLSNNAATAISGHAISGHADQLFVSAISAWEIALGVSKGRLELQMDPAAWVAQVIAKFKIQTVDVTWQIAVASVTLPRHHADPADGIIIATALDRGFQIVSPDQEMKQYAGVKIVW